MADQYKTRQQFVNRVGENLGLTPEGSALSAADYAKIDNLVDPAFALLSAMNIYGVNNDEEIEVAAFIPLAIVVANHLADTYGLDSDSAAKLQARATAAKAELKTIAAPARSRRTLKTPFITRAGAYYGPR